MISHKVKEIGESKYTICGIRYINNGTVVTQDGEVTCKKCVMLGESEQ